MNELADLLQERAQIYVRYIRMSKQRQNLSDITRQLDANARAIADHPDLTELLDRDERVEELSQTPIPRPPAFAEEHWTRGEIESWEEGALRFKALLLDALECRCGCSRDMHAGEIGCPCGLPDEPPCTTETEGDQ